MIPIPFPKVVKTHLIVDGLIAEYLMNGNAFDSSGNGYNGLVVGASLATGRKGNANGAYQFTKGSNHYIDISSIGHLPSISISAWVNYDSGSNMGVISKGNFAGNSIGDWCILQNSPYYIGTINNSGANNLYSQAISAGSWYHLAWMYGGGKFKFYVSNTSRSEKSIASLNNAYSTIRIGQYYGAAYSFNGRIDDVRIFDRELTTDEIAILYNE